MKDYVKLIISILICLSAGFLGSLVTVTGQGSWYEAINKPPITPPGIVFPIAWNILYILMGISLFLIWTQPKKRRKDPEKKKIALMLFGLQLFFNMLWSYLFFGLQSPIAGLMGIFVLLGLVSITIIKFYQLHEKAAYLLIPYLLWLCFATILNLWILILN